METAKKTYHMACKEEKLAATREADGKTQASVTTDQQKKLHEKTDKCKHDVQKVRQRGSGSDKWKIEQQNDMTTFSVQMYEKVRLYKMPFDVLHIKQEKIPCYLVSFHLF